MKVKVKVFGYASLIVSAVDPEDVYKKIDWYLAMDQKLEVHKVRRGAPRKSNPMISEGAAGAPRPFTGITNRDGE